MGDESGGEEELDETRRRVLEGKSSRMEGGGEGGGTIRIDWAS